MARYRDVTMRGVQRDFVGESTTNGGMWSRATVGAGFIGAGGGVDVGTAVPLSPGHGAGGTMGGAAGERGCSSTGKIKGVRKMRALQADVHGLNTHK